MSLRTRRLAIIGLSLAAICPLVRAQGPQRDAEFGAKALFYNAGGAVVSVATAPPPVEANAKPPSPQPTKIARSKETIPPAVLALRASVLLASANGGTREVRPSHPFTTGDKIKLEIIANRTGYFYLVSVGSAGEVQLLAPRRGDAAILEGGFHYQYPGTKSTYFKFDQHPGKEELWAVLSDEPLNAIDLGGGRVARVAQPDGGRDRAEVVASATEYMGSKGFTIEEDDEAAYASTKPVSLQQPNSSSKPRVMLKLVLDHQ
jgi:hypothetical protein